MTMQSASGFFRACARIFFDLQKSNQRKLLLSLKTSVQTALFTQQVALVAEQPGVHVQQGPKGRRTLSITGDLSAGEDESCRKFAGLLVTRKVLARIIHEFEDKRSLLCYKHVD
jgi:hypothetical protein